MNSGTVFLPTVLSVKRDEIHWPPPPPRRKVGLTPIEKKHSAIADFLLSILSSLSLRFRNRVSLFLPGSRYAQQKKKEPVMAGAQNEREKKRVKAPPTQLGSPSTWNPVILGTVENKRALGERNKVSVSSFEFACPISFLRHTSQ